MKKERKLELLNSFPPMPPEIIERMGTKRRFAENYVVFLTNGNELFARCYHHYYGGSIVERQRYVFAKDGCCRYGVDHQGKWVIRTEFREPVFCACYGYNLDNSYIVLNHEAIKRSCMRYSCYDIYTGSLIISYLGLYTKHPNIEYLMKSGYGFLISGEENCSFYYGNQFKIKVNSNVDLRPNNLLKMLGLNRTEFKMLKGSVQCYTDYVAWRRDYPNYKPSELLTIAKAFGSEFGTVRKVTNMVGLRLTRLAAYLVGQNISLNDYLDYLKQCKHLQYDLCDTAIAMPHNFASMHARLSNIIEYTFDGDTNEMFAMNYERRKELEFSSENYLIRQPQSMSEIVNEGKLLHHCVGGYARRHAGGELTILFVRKTDSPDVPLYTMELGNDGKIKQIRGKNNSDPTKEALKFVEQYKQYITNLFREKMRKGA